jgi:hypothetical protein
MVALCVPADAQNQPVLPAPEQSTPAPDVSSLLRDYQERLQQATQPADKQRIAEEGNSALKKAVEAQGLTIQEYNSIIVAAQNDAEVRNKILQRMHRPGEENSNHRELS